MAGALLKGYRSSRSGHSREVIVRGPALPPARPDSVFRFPYLALGTLVPTARLFLHFIPRVSPPSPRFLPLVSSCLFTHPFSCLTTTLVSRFLGDILCIYSCTYGPGCPALEILRPFLLFSSLDAPVCPLPRSSFRSSTTRLTRPRTSARGPHIF